MQPGEVSCTIALWVCASRFPTTVPTFHAFTIQLHDLSPVWRPHLSNLNDAWGQGAEGRPLFYLTEHVTAQKALYRKEPINSTFSQGNFFRRVWPHHVWHNAWTGFSEMENQVKVRSLRSDLVSLVQDLLI